MSSKANKLPSTLEPQPMNQAATTVVDQTQKLPLPSPPHLETATVTAPVQAPVVEKKPDSVTKAISSPSSSKKYLDLGAGYKISVNEGSGYWILLGIMAKRGHFTEVVATLEKTSPADKAQAREILSKAIVDRDELELAVRQDPRWEAHAQKRIKGLKMLAKSSSKAATAVLTNKNRVKGHKWLGNVREIISTCLSSYPKSTNRNTKKFDDAGVVFRQYPLEPKRGEKVGLMMFPAKYINTIRSCIETVYGVKEPKK